MNKLFPLIICVFFLTACDKNKNIEKPAEPVIPVKPETPETYKVKSVTYNVEGDNFERIFNQTKPSLQFTNKTSLEQFANINPSNGFMETSRFISDEKDAFNIKESDAVKIRTPSYINKNKEISLGEAEWVYSDNQKELQTKLDLKKTVGVPSYYQLNTNINLIVREYSTSYKAVLTGQRSGKEIVVKGTWKGTSLINAEVKTDLKKIE